MAELHLLRAHVSTASVVQIYLKVRRLRVKSQPVRSACTRTRGPPPPPDPPPLAHIINSLLCLSQLCHSLLRCVTLFFWDWFCLPVQLAACVVAPPPLRSHCVGFFSLLFVVFELRAQRCWRGRCCQRGQSTTVRLSPSRARSRSLHVHEPEALATSGKENVTTNRWQTHRLRPVEFFISSFDEEKRKI